MLPKSSCIFLSYLLLILGLSVEGCHNSLHLRRKRQASRSIDPVEETRSLRNYFSACMLNKIGSTFNWDSVIDFSILDTLWYERTNDQACRNDTVTCWQDRLLEYLRPSSNVLPTARSCIEQLSVDVEETGRIEYRRVRKKRSLHRYPYPNPTLNPDQILLGQYSQCIQGRIALPRNRRRLAVKSVVEFVEENAICGECSPVRLPSLHNRPARSLSLPLSSSSSSSGGFYSFASSVTSTGGHFSSSTLRRRSVVTYPFTFQALTLRSSPLLSPIAGCNRDFQQFFVPVADDVPIIGWTEWTSWGSCPARCGGRGRRTRTRTCPLGIPGVAPCLGQSTQRNVCRRQNCPRWSSWSSWSACPATCGRQRQVSRRRCLNGSAGQAGCPGRRERSRPCDIPICHGTWNKWTSWSSCSSTCGTGNRFRRRECPGPHRCVPDSEGNGSHQIELCNTVVCRKTWGKWGSWSKCPVTCGGSRTFIERRRVCNGERNLAQCEGPYVQRKKCGRKKCPGSHWGEWATWSDCTWKKRNRRCMGPPGSCPGSDVAYKRGSNCGGSNLDHWSSWSTWSTCYGNCYFGQKQRQRNCVQPRRRHGCPGNSYESHQCRPSSC